MWQIEPMGRGTTTRDMDNHDAVRTSNGFRATSTSVPVDPATPSLFQALGGTLLLVTVGAFWLRPYVPVVGMFLTAAVLSLSLLEGVRLRLEPGLAIVLLYAFVAAIPSALFDEPNAAARIAPTPALAAIVWGLAQPHKRFHSVFVGVLVASCLAAVLIMLFQVAPGEFDFSILGALTRQRGEYFLTRTEAYRGPNVIAPLIGVAMLGALFLFFRAKALAARTAAACVVSACLFALILTASRTAVVAGLTCAIIGTIILRPKRFQLRTLWTALLTIVALALVAAAAFKLTIEYSPDAVYRYSILLTGDADFSLRTRFHLWDQALTASNDNLFGRGFTAFLNRYRYTPHNEYLAQLVAVGIPGLLVFCTVVAAWGYRVLGGLRSSDIQIRQVSSFSGSCLLFSLGIGMTENFSASSLSLFWFVFWLLAAQGIVGIRYGHAKQHLST
jgi:O-antigen ligase